MYWHCSCVVRGFSDHHRHPTCLHLRFSGGLAQLLGRRLRCLVTATSHTTNGEVSQCLNCYLPSVSQVNSFFLVIDRDSSKKMYVIISEFIIWSRISSSRVTISCEGFIMTPFLDFNVNLFLQCLVVQPRLYIYTKLLLGHIYTRGRQEKHVHSVSHCKDLFRAAQPCILCESQGALVHLSSPQSDLSMLAGYYCLRASLMGHLNSTTYPASDQGHDQLGGVPVCGAQSVFVCRPYRLGIVQVSKASSRAEGPAQPHHGSLEAWRIIRRVTPSSRLSAGSGILLRAGRSLTQSRLWSQYKGPGVRPWQE